MSARAIRAWCQVHKWTSLVSTIFLLLLCITGLPLIFYHEIEDALGNSIDAQEMPANTPLASLDSVVATAKREIPDFHIQFVSWDRDHPGQVFVSMAKTPDAAPDNNRLIVVDTRTAQSLGEHPFRNSVMFIFFRLHVDIFAGLPGKLFLGFMGLLFVVAIISGVVVYAPFMRRLSFGTVRLQRSRRLKWLDLHNLLGIVTVAWALVVGLTGVINTWADLVIKMWQYDQLAQMIEPYKGKPPVQTLASLEAAVETARKATPGRTPGFVAYPQSTFSSQYHYAIFMRGESPLTSRLFKPVLIDASDGSFTATRDMPWYVTTLLVSQPLHFGDYGGMPLKVIWALLDLLTIIVLGSGLYLWLARGSPSLDARIAEAEAAEAAAAQRSPQAAE
jgi:uncharacterized iron-regulated membrane protein